MRLSEDLPLNKVPFVFLDVETTGLHPHYGDRICEIGLLKVVSNRTSASYHTLINPYVPISIGAFMVNHITSDMVKYAPAFSEVTDKFFKFIENSVIVAHNAPFDLNFIGSQLNGLRMKFPKNIVIDTLTLARTYFQFPSNSLSNIASHFGISAAHSHRAMEDAILTRKIFYIFLKEFKRKYNLDTLYQLLEFNGGTITFPTYGELILPPEVEEAIKWDRKLRIRYMSEEGKHTVRTIKPIEIAPHKDYTYLVAHCFLREQRRTFRMDRILSIKVVKE
ncbi:MAG: exonuclease domain-containing protein [bacterium]|nr:exonuclease domain-containing protein [bacterium]